MCIYIYICMYIYVCVCVCVCVCIYMTFLVCMQVESIYYYHVLFPDVLLVKMSYLHVHFVFVNFYRYSITHDFCLLFLTAIAFS